MFWPGLTNKQRQATLKAIFAPVRVDNVRVRLYGTNGEALGIKVKVLDGDVIMDDESSKDNPLKTCHLTLFDPKKRLRPKPGNVRKGLWFNKQIGLFYGVWVKDFPLKNGNKVDRWVYFPEFRGWVMEITEDGALVEVDCDSKEAQHQSPHLLTKGAVSRKGKRVEDVIKSSLKRRGEKKFAFPSKLKGKAAKIRKHKTWAIGTAPWNMYQVLIKSVQRNYILYVRGNGQYTIRPARNTAVLRLKPDKHDFVLEYPKRTTSVREQYNTFLFRGEKTVKKMEFTKTKTTQKANQGAEHIVVEGTRNISNEKKIRIGPKKGKGIWRQVTSTSGNQINFANQPLPKNFPKGARVVVAHRESEQKPVWGRAALKASHGFSSATLTGGTRPRVLIEENSNIHKKNGANHHAEQMKDDNKRGEYRHEIIVPPIPGLEAKDVLSLGIGKIHGRTKVVRTQLPVTGENMSINARNRYRPRIRRDKGKGGGK